MSLTTKPIKIAIIYGGRSSEHSVSCISAGAIMSHLDPEKYELYPIGITQQGTWTVGESDPEKLRSTNGAMPTVTLTKEVSLAADPARLQGRVRRRAAGARHGGERPRRPWRASAHLAYF